MRTLFRGIGWRVFLSFSTLLIILTLTLSFIALKFVQRSATDNAANELRVMSVLLSEQLQRHLKRIETATKSLVATGGYLDTELQKDNPSEKRLDTFLQSKLAQNTVFDSLSVFNTAGICVASTDDAWTGVPAQRELFFINGLKRFNFSEIFESKETGEKVLLVSAPINEGADPHGVIVARVKLTAIYDLMGQQMSFSPSSEAFLLDSKFRFITPGKGVPDELLQSHLANTPLVQHAGEEFWVGQYKNYKGTEVLGTVYRLPGNKWFIVVERDFREVEAKLTEVKTELFRSTIALLILLTMVTVLLTASITRPLKTLVESAQRIAAGDFNHPVTVPSGADEITFLAAEFDRMRARVAASQGRLIEQLEESEQRRIENERLAAIGTLASSLAHEIRNPLNAVTLLISRLERSKGPDADKLKMIDEMKSEISRLDRLVSDILDYARPVHLQKERLDLRDFMSSLGEFYRPIFDEKRISLIKEFPEQPVVIEADRDKLRQALVNLVQNAIEAMYGGGQITFKIETTPKTVKCVVRDTGVGIEQSSLRRLFDLFFTTKERGTGLGLSTVRKIVDAHGGHVDIESAPQKGTAVIIHLPKIT